MFVAKIVHTSDISPVIERIDWSSGEIYSYYRDDVDMTEKDLNGNLIPEGSDFTLNGFVYPYVWLENTTPSIRASLGIEATGDVNYDPKYYWDKDNAKHLEDREEVDDSGNPVFVKVWDATVGLMGAMVDSDKRLVSFGLKTTCLKEIKNLTNQLLQPTDFYIIRNAAEDVEIPTSVSEYRTAVVTESARLQEAIPAVTSVEELIEVMSTVAWPKAE